MTKTIIYANINKYNLLIVLTNKKELMMENKLAWGCLVFLVISALFIVCVVRDATKKNERFYDDFSITIEKTKSLNP